MNISVYHVDAFTDQLFSGNPAIVYHLKQDLPDEVMQTIAIEHNLPVTVFLCEKQDHFTVRWFAPEYEIPLCGHGSMAAGHIIFTQLRPDLNEVTLKYPTGVAQLRRHGDSIEFDFPVKEVEPCASSDLLVQGLGIEPTEVYRRQNERCLAIFSNEEQIKHLTPDMNILKHLDFLGIIVSAPGKSVDFVSRVFYPAKVMSEDAVTGSAHCILVPYWSKRLNKIQLEARQLSLRGGSLGCELAGDHIILRGKAVTYMSGIVTITS